MNVGSSTKIKTHYQTKDTYIFWRSSLGLSFVVRSIETFDKCVDIAIAMVLMKVYAVHVYRPIICINFYVLFLLLLVDDLFKEANIKSNGTVNYEVLTRMMTLPPVDY